MSLSINVATTTSGECTVGFPPPTSPFSPVSGHNFISAKRRIQWPPVPSWIALTMSRTTETTR